MKTKLDTLTEEHKTLTARIAELEAKRQQIRREMEADPMRRAAALAPKHGDYQTQIEVFGVRLGKVNEQIEAEQKRLASPEIVKGIKRAEKIVADGQKLHGEIVAEAEAMIARIDAAFAASQEAASLLRSAERDFLPYSGPYTELAELRQMIGNWIFARANRAALTAGFKQMTVQKEAEARAKAEAAAEAEAKAATAKAREAARHKKDAQEQKRAWFAIGGGG